MVLPARLLRGTRRDPQVTAAEDSIRLDTGALTPDQVRLVLDLLPLDLTFVDEQGLVRFYSERYRIFSRTPDVIGTAVTDCHSPGARPRIARLISELETGWRDDAEFLVEHDGRLVRVRYLAVRDDDGGYRGCLEVAQYVEDFSHPEGTPVPPA